MNEETLKAKLEWCVESINAIVEIIKKNNPKFVLKDEPPDEPPGQPKP